MKYLLKLLIVLVLLLQIVKINAQSTPCTPSCSRIANGDFEHPNVDSLTSQGLSTYGGAQYPSGGSPFLLGQVMCWNNFQESPHIWPNDTASSLNHFSVFGSAFILQNGVSYEIHESSDYSMEFCLDSGTQYKIRYDYLAYLPQGNINPYWEGWWSFNFTDNSNYNVYNPTIFDDVISTAMIGNDVYNDAITNPPAYLSISWHPVETDPFTYRGQEYLVLSPIYNSTIPDGAYATGIFIDNIEFIPYLEFNNSPLCDSASKFSIYTDNLNPSIDLEFSIISPNVSNCQNLGDSCIITVSGMTPFNPSEIILAYSITDTACNGDPCISYDTLTMILEQYVPMALSTSQLQEVSCSPNCDGIADVSTSNGIPPYQFFWSNGVISNLNNLACVGMNYITVTDSIGCYLADSVLITDLVHLSIDSVEILKCPCDTNNIPMVLVPASYISNGTSPYSFAWSTVPAQFSDTCLLAFPGLYSVTVTDANGCSDSLDFKAECIKFDYREIFNASCPGKNDGWIQSTSAARFNCDFPTPPITFYWSTGDTTYGGDVYGFYPGTYSVTFVDAVGLYGTDTITIGYDYSPSIQLNSTNVVCNDFCNGTIEAMMINTPSWPNINFQLFSSLTNQQAISQNTNYTFNSLCPDQYVIVATDSLGCQVTDSIVIEPYLFYDEYAIGLNNCQFTYIFNIDVTVTGSNPFSYSWNNGNTTQDIIANSPFEYILTITDSHNCILIDTVDLDVERLLVIGTVKNQTCRYIENGEIALEILGGQSTYEIIWNTGESAEIISNLGFGNYEVTVTDFYGCIKTAAFVLDTLSFLNVSAIENHPPCKDSLSESELGSIELEIVGGVEPYHFVWSDSSETQNLDSLFWGIYTVTVTDSIGCIEVNEINLYGILGISLDDIGQGCDTTPDKPINGYAWVNVTNGHPDYHYQWSNMDSTVSFIGDTTAQISGLKDFDIYICKVVDSLGCVGLDTIEIKSKQLIDLELGISYWSTYIDLRDTMVNTFFHNKNLDDNIIQMKSDLGGVYIPSLNYNLIGPFQIEGYQIQMPIGFNYNFLVEGSLICPEDYEFVSNGWEYIPYLRKDTSLIQDEFAGVTHLEIIKDTYGGVFWPIYSINTIGIMCPGQGYQAKFNSTQLWHYSPNNIDSVLDYEGTKSFLYNLVPNNSDIITDNSMVVGIPENCWDQAPILGDIIEAISEQGDVVGRSYYNNGFTAIVIFGDDLSTSTIQEGLQEGETFSLRIVSGSGEKTRTPNINLKSWSVGDGNYEKDKISVLALKNESNLPQLSSFELESLSPNPNSGEFELKIVSKLECECMVSIYDIEGKNVFIENKTILEGENTMQFNFNKLRQGQYQLFIQDNNLKESIKFQILKK